jgi:hypothetical protein
MDVFLECLSTSDLKQLAIAACDAIRDDVRKNGLPRLHEGEWHDDSLKKYRTTKMLQNLAELGFMCHMALCDYDEAVGYFRRHQVEENPEISLYVLLRLIEGRGNNELWVQTYEESIRRGVRPREELKRQYDAKRRESSPVRDASPQLALL